VDCNSRLCYLDPYEGGRQAIAEAARNLAVTGVRPLAVTDCLNFASPERPETMWQFAESIRGLADACRALDTPVVSGNVSFYNETDGRGIYPTPMIAMVGAIADPARAVPQAFRGAGDGIALLGRQTEAGLGGSEYLKIVHGKVAGRVAVLDIDAEKRLQALCLELADQRLLRSAHDLSEGGLAVALAEACVSGAEPVGATVKVPAGSLPEVAKLFGEPPSRVLVSFAAGDKAKVEAAAGAAGVPVEFLGETGGRRLKLGDHVDLALDEVADAWRGGFRKVVA
jgi:phosphoribosylformylglycinamidine synthase